MKKILAILLSIVLCTGIFSAGYVTADIYDGDDFDSTISFLLANEDGSFNTQSTGAYHLGDYFYFYHQLYATEAIKDYKFVRKVNFLDEDGDSTESISDFEYYNGSTWVDASKYKGTKDDTSPAESIQGQANNIRCRVKFNAIGKYLVEVSAVSEDRQIILTNTKYFTFANGTYKTNWDEETTTGLTQSPFHQIKIDNALYASVADGEDFTLNTNDSLRPGYGFFERGSGKIYIRGSKIKNVTRDLNFDTVDEITVTKPAGASLRVEAPAGIRFKSMTRIENIKGIDVSERVLKSGAVQIGTIITAGEYYKEIFDYHFERDTAEASDPNHEFHADILNPKDSWPVDQSNQFTYGTCYGGIIYVKQVNYIRDYVASSYARIVRQVRGQDQVEYIQDEVQSHAVPIRSIRQVAGMMRDKGYKNLTPEQIAYVEHYLED